MATDSKYPRSWVLEQRTAQPLSLPVFVVIPDWHFPAPQPLGPSTPQDLSPSTPQPLQPYLIPSEYDYLIQMGRVMGVNLHFTMPEETPAEFPPQAIGLIIAGGKDMHPQFYNQPVNGTILHEQSLTRFPQAMEAYQWARRDKAQAPQPLSLPILGICWGAQFLCVANGGSLIQHIPHADCHSHKQVSLSLLPSSWVSKTLNKTRYSTFCHHHQGLGSIPPNFTVAAWDIDGLPHAIERFDRGVLELGLQGHPEESLNDPDTVRLVLAFLDQCVKGKMVRDTPLAVESA